MLQEREISMLQHNIAIDSQWINSDDTGNLMKKTMGDYLGDNLMPGTFAIPSVYAPLSTRASDDDLPSPRELLKIDDDAEWNVFGHRINIYGDTSRAEAYNNITRYWSKWYLRHVMYPLMLAAQAQSLDEEEPIYPRVLLSVPASIYANKEYLTKVRQNLEGKNGTHTVTYQDDQRKSHKVVFGFDTDPKRGNVVIRPEGTGSYYRKFVQETDYEERGALIHGLPPTTHFLEQDVLVAAWGWLTLSVIGFSKGKPIQGFAWSNAHVGLMQLGQRLLPHIGNPINPPATLIDQWLRADDEISVNGHKHRIRKIRAKLAQELANEALNWAMTMKNQSKINFDVMLLTGGTTEYLFGGTAPLVKIAALDSADEIPGGAPIKSEGAPTDDAVGLWEKYDANRRYGV
jgi:hypothetical protein